MATTTKSEKVFIQIGEEVIELTGKEKETYLEQRVKDNAEFIEQQKQIQTQKELKISAYKKLGLTDEEIQAII